MKTSAYIVKQGDHLARIAHRFGVAAQELWDHPRNEDLRRPRLNPSVLVPGDVLHVPDPASPVAPLDSGAANTYVAEVPEVTVEVHLLDHDHQPLKKRAYRLCGLGEPQDGLTGEDGLVSFQAPVFAHEVDLFVEGYDVKLRLFIGHLHCASVPSGIVQRLGNLGHYRDPAADWPGSLPLDREVLSAWREAALQAALAAFQRQAGEAGAGGMAGGSGDIGAVAGIGATAMVGDAGATAMVGDAGATAMVGDAGATAMVDDAGATGDAGARGPTMDDVRGALCAKHGC